MTRIATSDRGARRRLIVLLAATIALASGSPAAQQTNGLAIAETHFDYSAWAVDATKPGPHLPPTGRSLFDYLVTQAEGDRLVYRVPFPFSALVERIQRELAGTEFGGGTRIAMIPMGRSLQRTAAAPDYFKYPRIVFAVTGEPKVSERDAGMLLKDRLYLGYVEKTSTLEVISYNEAAGRFEFQLVKDYRAGGEAKVYYANRAICVACHQNHAPIFSRAVWSESNANGRVAELLSQVRADFYDLPPQANLDFPDDIGQSTVRANALASHQSLWQRGCEGDGDRLQSRRCRAAAFTAILQYGLSGEHDLAAGSPRYHSDFVTSFGQTWRRKWPAGLQVAQAELPDRNPLGGGASYGGGGAADLVSDFLAASHVPADLDPLAPRAPRETWRFGGALDAYRYIVGWSRFFAPADFRALDAQLLRRGQDEGVQPVVFSAACALKPNPHSPYPLKLECDGAGARALSLRAKLTPWGSGEVEWLNLGYTGHVRDAQLIGTEAKRSTDNYELPATLQRKGITARLADGRAISGLVLRWPAAAGGEMKSGTAVSIELRVINDFARLRQAVDHVLERQPALFDAGPLRRTDTLQAIHSALRMSAQAWCCSETARMPAAAMEPVIATANPAADLQPLYHNCATCHQTAEHFPPNFLSGDANRVAKAVRQCAPRILVRLDAWHTAPQQRVKTPMPPLTYLPTLGLTPTQWTGSEEFRELRGHIESLVKSQGRPTGLAELLKDGYESLPICLPELAEVTARK